MNEKRRPAGPARQRLPTASPPVTGPASQAYAAALKTGVQAGVQTVRDMHLAIADKAFGGVLLVPGLSVPTRVVQGVHDAIAQGVYAAVRHGSGALMAVANVAERLATDGSRSPQGAELALRSALNGVFGDALADAGNALSVRMGFHANGTALPLVPEALAGLRPRVCLFIHGLACDESSWQRPESAWAGSEWADSLAPGEPVHYAALLAKDVEVSSIQLRYNTGLPVAENARQLAQLLQQWQNAAPDQVRELVLIGHSMGGLVARGACEQAEALQLPWRDRVRLLICLGTPHQGANLERLGRLSELALGVSRVTQPLARLAGARSQGIKDLGEGLALSPGRKTARGPAPVPLRFIAATLGDASDGRLGALIGNALGDGLVMPASATDAGLPGDVQRVELAGLGHMALLNHPRVYVHLLRWMAEAPQPGSAGAD